MTPLQLYQEQEFVRQAEKVLHDVGPFISLAEASRVTGVSLATLSEAVREGRIPALRVQARRWLVRLTAVRNYFGQPDPADLTMQKRLLASGLLTELKFTTQIDDFEPVSYAGESASQLLIAERR